MIQDSANADMRRFSQRSHLVTLSDINITPLLDLAFVLLIIFIITTPLMEGGTELKLPTGGKTDRQLKREDFRIVEVSGNERYKYEGHEVTFAQLGQVLAFEQQKNPSVVIFIRADRAAPWQDVYQVTETCANLGLGLSYRAEPPDTP